MVDVMSSPSAYGNLRACVRCKLIKTENQFEEDGCENCPTLGIAHDPERVMECTSPHFAGIVSLMQPRDSWVGSWNGLESKIPGCYCIDVDGDMFEGEGDDDNLEEAE